LDFRDASKVREQPHTGPVGLPDNTYWSPKTQGLCCGTTTAHRNCCTNDTVEVPQGARQGKFKQALEQVRTIIKLSNKHECRWNQHLVLTLVALAMSLKLKEAAAAKSQGSRSTR
jgi:hypothetical protein